MLFLKCFEHFTEKEVDFKLVINKPDNKIYNLAIDDIIYYVEFSLYEKNIWLREYDTKKGELEQVNKNPFNIVSGITQVTKDFIKNNNPNAIFIQHIPMNNENQYKPQLNKRAKINYNYLKNISGYKLEYYNQLTSGQLTTVCYMVKPTFIEKYPFAEFAKNYLFDDKGKRIRFSKLII
jgi:hypothetical protein